MDSYGKVRSFRLKPVQAQQLQEVFDDLRIPPGPFQNRIVSLIEEVHRQLNNGRSLHTPRTRRQQRPRPDPEPDPARAPDPEPDRDPEPDPEPDPKPAPDPEPDLEPEPESPKLDPTYVAYLQDQQAAGPTIPQLDLQVCPYRDEWIQPAEFCPGCQKANPKMYTNCVAERQKNPYGPLFQTTQKKPGR